MANERAYIYCILRPENKGHNSCSFCGCFILIVIHFNFNNATKIKVSPTVNPEAITDELKYNKRQVTIIDHMQGIEMIASICSHREATAARFKEILCPLGIEAIVILYKSFFLLSGKVREPSLLFYLTHMSV